MKRTPAEMTARPQQNVPFADYLKWPYVSQSSLKEGRKSMLDMKTALEEAKVPTDAMNLSSALHCGFLEPELLPERVVLWDGKRRAGKEWDAFKDEHDGKIILTNGLYENLKSMLRSVRRHPEIQKWYSRPGDVEVSHKATINGVMVKGRVDKLTDDPIIDLKSSGMDLDVRTFANHVVKMGWHIQGAIYLRLFNRKRFILGVVQQMKPWDVVMFELPPELLEIGDAEAMMLLSAWQICCKKQDWPGRSDQLEMIEVPKWMQTQQELTTGGVPVKLSS